MNLCRTFQSATCATALAFLSLSPKAQSVAEPTPLANTVSIGDVLHAEEAGARSRLCLGGSATTPCIASPLTPIHLIYVHGMNDIGPNDSFMLRKAICRYAHECLVQPDKRFYAEGPFALTAAPPALDYLQQRIWASPEEWRASAPFIQRYRISGRGHAPIVLDELDWYPLVYPLKCKFLLPGDAYLTGSIKAMQKVCQPPANQPDLDSPGHFLAYRWPGNAPLFTTDLPQQHATLINRSLKINVMDWGFGDAVLALGPMREILTAAIRQLLAQSLDNVIPGVTTNSVTPNLGAPCSTPSLGVDHGNPPPTRVPPCPGSSNDPPVFFVTHSLGSYLSLTAMDSGWLGASKPQLPGFGLSSAQANAVDYLAWHTVGFYFLANQISLLEFARLSAPSPLAQPDCSPAAAQAEQQSTEPAAAALSHYGCMRHNYLNSLAAASAAPTFAPTPAAAGPQIIAWSAADDILSWYVPAITGVAVVNLPAHNSGLRIPWLIAEPLAAHNNYAKNPAVVRRIFTPTPH